MADISLARKKELKEPDELFNFLTKILDFIVKNKNKIIIAISSIVLIIAVYASYNYYTAKQKEKASVIQMGLMAEYEHTVDEKGADATYYTMKNKFENYFKRFSNLDSSEFVKLSFAHIAFEAKDYDNAIRIYQNFLSDFNKNKELNTLVKMCIAYAYLAKKDYDDAIKYFEQLSSSTLSTLINDEILLNLALAYEQTGQRQKAKDMCKQILTAHPNSLYIPIVKDKLKKL